MPHSRAVLGAAVLLLSTGVAVAPAGAAGRSGIAGNGCAPNGVAISYSDALDKATRAGATVGGLSSLAYDARAEAWVSAVDNHDTDPSRLWFFRDLSSPRIVRDPLVLRRPDGTPYDGTTADNEGLAVLPDGDYVVSSETEPSIRIFGRDGVQKSTLRVPARFAVAPAGQATANATLEGLTISPSGKVIVAAMEGALSGDVVGTNATAHRFLVYRAAADGTWTLTKQVGYRAAAGNRVPEVALYSDTALVVEEAAFSTTTGNSEELYAVPHLDRAPDVAGVRNLGASGGFAAKRLVADLVQCPTLGAPSRETQSNPLLDNYEGMAVTFAGQYGVYGISLISDDNFSATQYTRVLNLTVRLPR